MAALELGWVFLFNGKDEKLTQFFKVKIMRFIAIANHSALKRHWDDVPCGRQNEATRK
jgi:hypothetical protein